MSALKALALLACALLLSACRVESHWTGGPAVEYRGVTAPAYLDEQNSRTFAASLLDLNHQMDHLLTARSVSGSPTDSHQTPKPAALPRLALTERIRQDLKTALPSGQESGAQTSDSNPAKGTPQQAQKGFQSDLEPCALSGYRQVDSDLDHHLNGVMEIRYDHCHDGHFALDGDVSVEIHHTNPDTLTPEQFSLYFAHLQVEASDGASSLGGRISVETDTLGGRIARETHQEELVIQNHRTYRTIRLSNWISVKEYDLWQNGNNYRLSLSGTLFDSTEGYVQVSTPIRLYLDPERSPYPTAGGELLLEDRYEQQLRIRPQADGYVDLVLDGDRHWSLDSHWEILAVY